MAYLGLDETKTVRNETISVAANNQTTFYPRGGYAKGYIDVYVDGVKKILGTDFTAPDNMSVVFTSAVANNSKVSMVAYGPVAITSVVNRSGDAMEGNLTVPNLIVSSNLESNVVTTQVLFVENAASFSYGANISGPFFQAGDMSVTGNLTLSGSLIITGNATSISTSTLNVEDTLVKVGSNNSTDSLDIGIAGMYSNGSANLYTGVFRDATDKRFYFFSGYDQSPGNDIDTTDPSFVTANVVANFQGNLTSNSILVDTLSAGIINMTASLHLQGDASGIKQDSTSIYGGDAGAGEGRIEYYSDAWVLNAGSDSNDILRLQRGVTTVGTFDNTGVYSGTTNNATYFSGANAAYYLNVVSAVNDTTTTTLYPLMVDASGAAANTKTTTSKFYFNANTGSLTATGIMSAGAIKSGQQSITVSGVGTTTLDLGTYDHFYITMQANTTFALSNTASKIGSSGNIILVQDTTGGRFFTKATEMKTPVNGASIVQTTTGSSVSVLSYYVVNSSFVIVNYIGGFA